MTDAYADLSENDQRVLRAVDQAQCDFDGYAPHGAADWLGIRRLVARGLVEFLDYGVCEDCDSATHRAEPTEVPIYVLAKPEPIALDLGSNDHVDCDCMSCRPWTS